MEQIGQWEPEPVDKKPREKRTLDADGVARAATYMHVGAGLGLSIAVMIVVTPMAGIVVLFVLSAIWAIMMRREAHETRLRAEARERLDREMAERKAINEVRPHPTAGEI